MRGQLFIAGVSFVICFAQFAHSAQTSALNAKYRRDQILVMPKSGVSLTELGQFHSRQQTVVLKTFRDIRGLQVVHLPPGESVADCIARYQQSGLVEFAEPDYEIQLYSTMPRASRL